MASRSENIKNGVCAILVALALHVPAASAETGSIKVSCVQGGRVVYREDLPGDIPANLRLEIATAHRPALCAFVKTSDGGDMPRDGSDFIPKQLVTGDESDLASALAFLSTGQQSIGKPYGDVFDEGMQDFMKTDNVFESKEGSVNLTIGVYSSASPEDVLGHWAFIKKNSVYLAQMTPSIERVGDITVLSVQDVSDGFAAKVCEEADKYASGCLAVF